MVAFQSCIHSILAVSGHVSFTDRYYISSLAVTPSLNHGVDFNCFVCILL